MQPKALLRAPLLPSTPPDLPVGLDRGGIFEAAYVPQTFMSEGPRTLETDSPIGYRVTEDIFRRPVGFEPNMTVKQITPGMGSSRGLPTKMFDPAGMRAAGMGGSRGLPTKMFDPAGMRAAGMGAGIFGAGSPIRGGMKTGTAVPAVRTMTKIVENRMPGLGGQPHAMHSGIFRTGMGAGILGPGSAIRGGKKEHVAARMARYGHRTFVPGVGQAPMMPNPQEIMQRAGPPPQMIPSFHQVQRPIGTQEGGVFGHGYVKQGMATGAGVPGVPTMLKITPPVPMSGFGAGPDGIGGNCGCGG